jgi:hypothetical protein
MNWFKRAKLRVASSYQVTCDIPKEQAAKSKQLAYAVNLTNHAIQISVSGHATMMRGNLNQGRQGMEGGWIFPLKQKIQFYSGSLGHVTDQNGVSSAIENFLGVYLYPV